MGTRSHCNAMSSAGTSNNATPVHTVDAVLRVKAITFTVQS